jgi:hypothetical protein
VRIASCLPCVPFVRGGVEIFAETLAEARCWLEGHCDDAREFGRAGKVLTERVSWNTAIELLLS